MNKATRQMKSEKETGCDKTAANGTNRTTNEKLRAVVLVSDALRRVQTKIYFAGCEKPRSCDTEAAPDNVRGDSVFESFVTCACDRRFSQAKRHKGRQTAAGHQPQALIAVTPPPAPPRGFKRVAPWSGAELQSWLHKQRMCVATLEREANSRGG